MAIKKRPISPRQKMINLMYIVLMAMLALNVSNDVLKGFTLVGNSLSRTTENAMKENQALYADFKEQLRKNPQKVQSWFNKAQEVKNMSDSLYNFAEQMKWAIARMADGKDANPNNLRNKEDLNAAEEIMLGPAQRGKQLYDGIVQFRERILAYISDPRQHALVMSNLSTDVPKTKETIGQNWQEYMFEQMPAIAAVTMLSKLQSDVRKAENEVLHTLIANVDLKDIRVNELGAYVLPEATTLFPGDEFRSQIFMAAVDTTQRPQIFVNGREISSNGQYNFRVGSPGEYSFSGYIMMPNAAGEIIRRDFTQKYNVIAPPNGATVAADLMNVLYAGYNNPISVGASGISPDKISLSMTNGTLTSQGNGKYIAKPTAVGQDVTFSVSGVVNGKQQTMGNFTFRVRKLPDPTAYVVVGGDHFKGGRLSKSAAAGIQQVGAAIDDGLLDIPFRVLSFEMVFFDRMGNTRPERASGTTVTENQRELIRSLRPGQRFYISGVRAIGPDGIERTLTGATEIIVQ